MDLDHAWQQIADSREAMISDMVEMSRICSINPRMGGPGEYERMGWIMRWFDKRQIPYTCYEIPDRAVKEGVRRNVVVTIPGKKETNRSLWLISHVDTVGTGDLSAWKTNPLEPVVQDGKIYGLGCEDNSQAVISTMYACALLHEQGIQADCNIRFYYAADEETGSDFGMKALLDQGLIQPEDEALVPDGGSVDGSFLEIAEKSQVWLKFTVMGKTAHAAMPALGINACSIGMRFGVELEDTLKEKYSKADTLFNPPESTFELTQKFSNVESPNILPGKDQFCMDMRILPCYSVDEVLNTVDEMIRKYETSYEGVSISKEFLTRTDAPAPTDPHSKVVERLRKVLEANGCHAYCGGIGGGTCGAILRKKQIPAVIWATLDETCHSPNEYVVIDNLIRDTQIYLALIEQYIS